MEHKLDKIGTIRPENVKMAPVPGAKGRPTPAPDAGTRTTPCGNPNPN